MKDIAPTGQRHLKHYNPVEGLKTVAVAEAAENHFLRAKDAEQLYSAIETKLRAQAEFVLWWDGQRREGGDKRSEKYHRNGPVTVVAGRDGIPDRMVLSRWRKLLDEAKLLSLLKEAQERCRRICEMDKTVRGTQGTGENEWYTPEKYIELARKVLGEIDLDPASSNAAQEAVKAKQYFTEENSGLKQEWNGSVWLNPPYAQPLISEFVAKLIDERCAERVTAAIMLTHNYTDTSWFHQAVEIADAICFTRGRVRFVDAEGAECAPTQGQAFFYFGDNVQKFSDVFTEIGFIARI